MKIQLQNSKNVYELFQKEIKENPNHIIATKINNEIVSLNTMVQNGDDIELIDITDKEGMRIYQRGLLFVMAKAFSEIVPKALITVHYQLSNAIYSQIVNQEIDQETIEIIENRMKEIIQQNLEIRKVKMIKEEAKAFYEKTESSRRKLQLYAKEKKYVSLYYCEEYFNYFYGVMPISTGFMPIFKLEKYQDGVLLRYPASSNPNQLGEHKDNKKLFHALMEYEDLHRELEVHTIHKLNMAVESGKIKDIILLDEALHEKKIAEIANDIVKREKVKMILIAGPSSSGKTTFAQRLGIQLKINGLKPVTISVDNYFLERGQTPRDEKGEYDFESIEAIDLKLFNEHLTKLLAGEEIKVPTFDFLTGTKQYKGNTMKLRDDEILVIEGIHCLNDKLTQSIPKEQKYKIYISALTVLNVDYYNRISTTDSRLIRRIVRDYKFRGYSALHTLRMWDSVRRGEERNIFPFQEEADMMFNTSLIYELGVLKPYALPLLKEIDKTEKEYTEAKRMYDFLRYFLDIPSDDVPKNSLLREFIGGGAFEQ